VNTAIRVIPAIGAITAVVILSACGGAGNPATTTATRPAASAPAASVPKATPSASAGTIACQDIKRTVSAVYVAAQNQAKAKHAQFPNVSLQSLQDAYVADDFDASGQALAANEQAAGITPGLKAAEQELFAASLQIYANYGQDNVTAPYEKQVQQALGVITKTCG